MSEGTQLADRLFDSAVGLVIEVNETAIGQARMLESLEQTETDTNLIAAAAAELAGSARSMGNTTTAAATATSEARLSAEQVQDNVNQARGQMDAIQTRVDETQQGVQRLRSASDEVGTILTTIDEVARQTRLLALNAAIEAARAGEAGKGFAVVASEVRNLSTETSGAIVEIHRRIERIESEVRGIQQQLVDVVSAVAQGGRSMSAVSTATTSLQANIVSLDRQMGEARQTVRQQLEATEGIANEIQRIATHTRDNTATLRAGMDSTRQMVEHAEASILTLTGYEFPDRVLRVAQADHVLWKKKLVDLASGSTDLDPAALSSHHHCRLGRWYHSQDSAALHHLPEWEELDGWHRKVHESGIEAARLLRAGDRPNGLSCIEQVEEASVEVLRLLRQLRDRSRELRQSEALAAR